ncbi:MAG: hypothetical protein ACREK5_07515 [Gemmatimonadota bacterium]
MNGRHAPPGWLGPYWMPRARSWRRDGLATTAPALRRRFAGGLIHHNDRKSDGVDAKYLAQVGRLDPTLLAPIEHLGAEAQADLACSASCWSRLNVLLFTRARLGSAGC